MAMWANLALTGASAGIRPPRLTNKCIFFGDLEIAHGRDLTPLLRETEYI